MTQQMRSAGGNWEKRLSYLAGVTAFGSALTLLPLTAAIGQTLPQGMASPGSSDLQATVQQAMVTNPEVRAAWSEFRASGHDLREASGNYLPSVDVSAGVGREDREGDARGSYDTQFAELTLNQMIYDGFATRNEVERLDRVRLAHYYELLGASEEVALQAARAYFDVQRYRELVRLAQENYAEHRRVYEQIEERVRSGTGRGVDLQQINGRLALAESNLMTEASNLHDVSARYQRIVGNLPAKTLRPAPEMDDRLPPSVAAAVDMAFEGNPDFHAAITNIDTKRAEESQTQAAFQPRLDLRGRTGTYENNDGSFDPLGDRRDRHRIELVASMNLYNGGSDLASFRAASERVEQATDLRDKACHDVRQTTQIAFNDTQRLREQLQYLNEHRQSIDRVRGAYQQQFDIGERTLLDVLDSENEFFEASRAYVNAVYDIRIADAETLAAMGQLMQTLAVRRDDLPTLAELGSDGVALEPDTVCPVQGPAGFTLDDLTGGMRAAPAPERAPDVTLSADALFAVNSAELGPDARDELNALAQQIGQRSDLARVFIAGHADNTGSDAINDPLSQRRADSVASYLVSQGVSAELIETRGYGSREPVASNSSAEGRRQNRRVEVTLESHGESAARFELETPSVSQQAPSVTTGTESAIPTPVASAQQSFLQVAALSRHASAQSLRDTLSESLGQPARLASRSGLHRVQVGPLSESELQVVQQRLGDLGYRDAYAIQG